MTRGKGGGRYLAHKRVLAIVALALAACAPRDEVPTFLVVRKPFRHQVTALGNLKAAKVTRLTVPQEVKGTVRLAWLASEGRLEEGDVVARFDPAGMRDRLREGRLDRDSARLEMEKARLQSDGKVADFDTSLQVAELELGHAKRYQKTDDSVFSRHEIIESEIDEELAGERREHADVSRETEKVRGRTEVEILEIKKRRAQLEIDQAEKGLDALEVRAPHGGLFTLTRNWRGEPLEAGSEMWRGQPIGELPDLTLMEAEVFVLEADAGGLETGRGATVIVEAHPEKAFPARIRLIDAVARPRFRGSPVQYFGVTLEFESADGLPMKPGHRVRAVLLLEEIGEAVVIPRQAVFTQGNEHRVYVKNGSGFAARKVEVGTRSVGLVVVSSGLDGGEVIALRRPVDPEEETEDAGSEAAQSQ